MNKIKCEIQSNILKIFPLALFSRTMAIFILKSIKMKFGTTSALRKIAVSMTKLTRALCLMLFV